MPSDVFDNISQKSYNNENDSIDFSQPIHIDMRNKKPENDVNCQHEWYLDAQDPDSSWANVWKCRNCPYGKLTSK